MHPKHENQPFQAYLIGGSLDGAGHPDYGYSLRGGRMLTTDNYECTWGLFRSIPSLEHAGQTVFDETVAFNALHQANAMARLIDCRRAKVPVHAMGFSLQGRLELHRLSRADEAASERAGELHAEIDPVGRLDPAAGDQACQPPPSVVAGGSGLCVGHARQIRPSPPSWRMARTSTAASA